MGSEERSSSHLQLLPGIPDHITLDQIVSRLASKDRHLLSLVSRSWEQAIQRHEVHREQWYAVHGESMDSNVNSELIKYLLSLLKLETPGIYVNPHYWHPPRSRLSRSLPQSDNGPPDSIQEIQCKDRKS